MITDPARTHRRIPGNPEVCNVYAYHRIFTSGDTVAEIDQGCRTAALGCVECKGILSGNLVQLTEPIFDRRREWESRGDEVLQILEDGSARAREVASETMQVARRAMNVSYVS
jgi:tryptophanyl-tRNA synthetase